MDKPKSRKIFNLKSIFWNQIAKIASPLVLKRKNLWAFGEGYGDQFQGNAKYLFLHVNKNHPEIKTVWFTRKNEIYNELKSLGMDVVKINSLKSVIAGFSASKYIFTHSVRDIQNMTLRNAKLINLWHGMPIKDITKVNANELRVKGLKLKLYSIYENLALPQKEKKFDLMILTSEYFKEIMKKSFPLCDKFVVTGEPRTDAFKQKLSRNVFFDALGIPQNKKIISYLPTFRDKSTTKPFPESIIRNNLDCFFIEKRHINESNVTISKNYDNYLNLTNVEYSSNVDTISSKNLKSNLGNSIQNELDFNDTSLREKNQDRDNYHHEGSRRTSKSLTNIDTQKLMQISDVVITDYSSLYFDFLLLDKPIIFYAYDYKEYKTTRNFGFPYDEIISSKKINTEDELNDVIINLDILKDYRKEKRKLFHKYNDFKSSERCFNAIQGCK